MFWCCKKRYIIYKPQCECVSDASRYSTLAPAHWTCMVLQNARKTVEDRRQKSVGAEQLVNKGQSRDKKPTSNANASYWSRWILFAVHNIDFQCSVAEMCSSVWMHKVESLMNFLMVILNWSFLEFIFWFQSFSFHVVYFEVFNFDAFDFNTFNFEK